MRKNLLAIVSILMLGLLPVAAQTDTGTCGTLSADYCDALLNSQDTMAEIRSLSFASESRLSFLSADGRDEMNLRMIADGHYHFNIQDIPPASNITEWLSGMMKTLQLEMQITIEDSDDALSNLGLGFPFALEFRVVDGFIYVNMQAFEGSAEPQWFGLDLVELIVFALQQGQIPPTTPIPAVEEGVTGLLGLLVALGGDMTRLDDEGNLWVFEESVSGDQILADEEIKTTLIFGLYQGFQQQAALIGPVDNDELLEMTAAYVELIPYMTLWSQRTIDPATGYLHTITFEMDYSPDAETVRELLASVSDPLDIEILTDMQIDFSIGLNMKNFDAAPVVVAPADAIVIPFRLIESLIPSGSEM